MTATPLALADAAIAAMAPLDAIVLVDVSHEVNTRWARNTVTTNGDVQSAMVTLIGIQWEGGAARSAGLTRPLADLDLPRLVEQVTALTLAADPAPDAAPLIPAGRRTPDLDAPAGAVDLSGLDLPFAEIGDMFARGQSDGIEHFGYLEVAHATTWLASSSGLRVRHDQPATRLELTAKSHARTRSTWAGFAGRDLGGADLPALDAQLRQGLAWQQHHVDLPPGRHPVLLSPSATADLMIDLYWGADGRSAVEGRSAFSAPGGSTLIGQRLSERPLHLHSAPGLPGQQCPPVVMTTASADTVSVFDNGLPLEPTDWIRDGVVRNLVTTRHSAARTGLPVRPWIDNLVLAADGTGDLAGLIGRTEQAVLVTCTWYNRIVDPHTHMLTGLTRDGTYLVRDGEVVGALPNFRFNDSPLAVLSRIRDASAPAPTLGREMGDYFTRATMPALLVDAFNLSSVSEAV